MVAGGGLTVQIDLLLCLRLEHTHTPPGDLIQVCGEAWDCLFLTGGTNAAGLGSIPWAAVLDLFVLLSSVAPAVFHRSLASALCPVSHHTLGSFSRISILPLNLFLMLCGLTQVSVATTPNACLWPSAGFPNSITFWEIRLFHLMIIRAIFTRYRNLGNYWKMYGSKWKVIQNPVALRELLMRFFFNHF